MKIHAIYSYHSYYAQNKSVNNSGKTLNGQATDLRSMPMPNAYLPIKYNVNFKRYEFKKLSKSNFEILKNNTKKLAEQKKILFDESSLSFFENCYTLQLLNFLLNHKVIEDDNLKNNLGAIATHVLIHSDKFRHEMWREKFPQVIDKKLLKSNCEAIMDFADFISNHSIYSNPKVKEYMPFILGNVQKENITKRKIMANYLGENPQELDNEYEIYSDLATDRGYEINYLYNDKFHPEKLNY